MADFYTFQDLFTEQLNDLLSAEEKIIKILPRYIEVASSNDLREALGVYQGEVSTHIDHLIKVFSMLNISPSEKPCKAIEGALTESEGLFLHAEESPVKDALLITIIQRLSHLKMAIYGAARTYARHLDDNQAMNLLQHALNDEGEMDRRMTKLAEGGVFTTGINEAACRVSLHA